MRSSLVFALANDAFTARTEDIPLVFVREAPDISIEESELSD